MEASQVFSYLRNCLISMAGILSHEIEVTDITHVAKCLIKFLKLASGRPWLIGAPT